MNEVQHLHFAYMDGDGLLTKRALKSWVEEGHYLRGYDLTVAGPRTFRKDRIVDYFDGSDAFLSSPIGIQPPRLHKGPGKPPDERPQIVFTGFAAAQRAHLEKLSDAAGLSVVKSVTVGLVFLCAGPNAGPKKIEKARRQHVYIVREPELMALLETGELPDYAVEEVL